jgi:uncharacterized repeat protein (TIGR01451 family)
MRYHKLLLAFVYAMLAIAPIARAQESDILVLKTGPAIANADTDVSFNIALTNMGPDDSATVTLSDVVTGGWSFVSVTPAAGFSCSDPGAGATSGTVTCTAASMTAGSTANFTIVFHIPPATPDGTSFTNVATVSCPTDPNDENNGSAVVTSTPPPPMGDVSIVKTGPTGAAANTDVAYTISVTNAGPSAATMVSFSDTLPTGVPGGAQMTFVSFTQNSGPAFNCGVPSTTTTCTLDPMPAGSTATFTFTGHVPNGTATDVTFTNDVTVTSTNDPNGENNTGSTSLIVSSADIGVTKTGPATAIAGGPTYDYVVTLSNGGPDAGTDVSFSDTLPAGLTFVSLTQDTGPAASCNTSGTISCAISLLGNGQSAQFTITVQPIASIANGTVLNNTATATASSADTNSNNNSATAATTISTQADVSITKTAPASATAGSNLSYSITVTNGGPSNAANVAWTDTLPAGTTFVSLTQTTGPAFTCTTGATVNCNIATLTSGTTATFTLVVKVSPSTPTGTVITNTANVTSTTTDNNAGNNSSSAASTVSTSADLAVTKTGPASTPSNAQVTYTVTVSNAGPSDATSVTLTDNVPANTTFASESQMTGPAFSCATPAPGGTGAITCTIATLAAGASASFEFVFNVPAGVAAGTVITNTASVGSTTPDANSANNSATVTTTVVQSIPAMSTLMLLMLALVVSALALLALRR